MNGGRFPVHMTQYANVYRGLDERGTVHFRQVLLLLAKIQLISISSKYSHNFPFFIHNSPIDTERICGFPRESSQPGHAIRGSTGFPELLSFCRVKSNRLFASSPRGMNG